MPRPSAPDLLRQGNLRVTPKRRRILETFLSCPGHPSLEELHRRVRRRDPGVAFSTVYRTMKAFAAAGIARERRFGAGETHYEVGLERGHHHHLLCQGCGRIEEFQDPRLAAIQASVARRTGYRITGHRLDLHGLCPRCQENP